MAGIIDFITDLGGDRELGGEFLELISQPDCTQQELVDFFNRNDYGDVTPEDADKIIRHRNHIAEDYGLQHTDY